MPLLLLVACLNIAAVEGPINSMGREFVASELGRLVVGKGRIDVLKGGSIPGKGLKENG